jgi:hypothetical protein
VLRRWVVKHGPQFDESKDLCDAAEDRLTLALNAIELNLERDPLYYSETFGDDARRVIETRDYYEGFILTAYVILYVDFSAEIRWIATRPLPDDDQENGGSDDDPDSV